MEFRKILEDHFRNNGHPIIADGIASGRMAMVDEIAAMKTVREMTIEDCAKVVESPMFDDDVAADQIRALRTNHL